jgi:hypothetical protein
MEGNDGCASAVLPVAAGSFFHQLSEGCELELDLQPNALQTSITATVPTVFVARMANCPLLGLKEA